MHKKLLGLLIIITPALCQAQFGGLLKKAKSKVEQRIDSKVDNEMNKTLDQVEGKPTTSSNGSTATTPTSTGQQPIAEKETVKSYSKFDFVPGEKIILRLRDGFIAVRQYVVDFAHNRVRENAGC